MDDEKNAESRLLHAVDYSAWKERLEVGAKSLLALVGTAYVIGLLILNFHVRTYGINYMNFLQIEYVLVGVLWIFLLAVSCIILASIYNWILAAWKAKPKADKHGILLKIGFFGLKLLIPLTLSASLFASFSILIIDRLTESSLPLFSRSWFFGVGILFVQAALLFGLGKLAQRMIKTAPRSPDDHLTKSGLWDDGYFLAANLVSLIFCISAYSTYLFPYLSSSYGGGRNQVVQILIKEEGVQTVENLGFRFLPDSRNIGRQELILEASDFLLLAPPEGHDESLKAIRMRKDMIDAIYYLSEK